MTEEYIINSITEELTSIIRDKYYRMYTRNDIFPLVRLSIRQGYAAGYIKGITTDFENYEKVLNLTKGYTKTRKAVLALYNAEVNPTEIADLLGISLRRTQEIILRNK